MTANKNTAFRQYNAHGRIRKMLLCPPEYYRELTISEIAQESVDAGRQIDRDRAKAQHLEMVDALRHVRIPLQAEH